MKENTKIGYVLIIRFMLLKDFLHVRSYVSLAIVDFFRRIFFMFLWVLKFSETKAQHILFKL